MKIIKTKMTFQAIEMTPEFAQELFDKNHPNNRKIKKGRVDQYDRENRAGLWILTPQPIVRDEDGWLVDGQNRCIACIRSGIPMPVTFCDHAPRRAILGMDCGANRNVADAARIAEVDLPHGSLGFAGIARRMALGLGQHRNNLSIQETLIFVESHREALEFSYTAMPKNIRFLTQAPIRAVIARAWYRRNSRTRIKEFADVFTSGLPYNVDTDQAAIRLRNWITDTMGKRGGARPSSVVVYAKAEWALHAFLAKEPVERINAANQELFPIMGEYESNGEDVSS